MLGRNKYGKNKKLFIGSRGYLHTSLTDSTGETKNHDIHRLVAYYYVDNPDKKPQVNHKDGDKTNNHYKNLEWVTNGENLMHASETGLAFRGLLNGRSKLTKKEVLEIRKKYKPYNFADLSKEYRVSVSAIKHIVYRNNWKHV